MKKTILLTGGLGYIGSITAHMLHSAGYQVIIIDSLVYNQTTYLPGVQIIKGDIGNSHLMESLFDTFEIDAVMHFAGLIEVGESVKYPDRFYLNNVANTVKLLDTMRQHGVNSFIFSSSCAVYGNPAYVPMDENHPYAPLSPYGKTKLAVEYALEDYTHAYGLKYVSLRYFNASGALPEHKLGECHNPETHVIPLLLRAAMDRKPFAIFGTDYDTVDGTCIRDYIHVADIAQAHILALEYLCSGGNSEVFNLGTGTGYSVRQLIDVAQRVCKQSIGVAEHPRRPGDAAVLVANANKIKKVLSWQPQHADLERILHDAWVWEQKRYKGIMGSKDHCEVRDVYLS